MDSLLAARMEVYVKVSLLDYGVPDEKVIMEGDAGQVSYYLRKAGRPALVLTLKTKWHL